MFTINRTNNAHTIYTLLFQAYLQFSWISGPRSRIIIKGSPLKSVYSILPSQKTIGVSVSVFTYTDDIFISVTTDSAIGEGFGETLLLNIKQQIDQMYELLRYRRVPKDLKSDVFISTCFKDLSSMNIKEVNSTKITIFYLINNKHCLAYSQNEKHSITTPNG